MVVVSAAWRRWIWRRRRRAVSGPCSPYVDRRACGAASVAHRTNLVPPISDARHTAIENTAVGVMQGKLRYSKLLVGPNGDGYRLVYFGEK